MKVKYSKDTEGDFDKHIEYLRRKGKSDGHKYQTYELDGINKSFKNNITKGLKSKIEHKSSIFPKEFDYDSDNYKMYVDKPSHHIVFYKIVSPRKGNPYIIVDKCIHSTELKRQLEEKGIEPLKNADQTLLDDLKEVYKEDKINQRDDSDEESGKEKDDYDKETGEKVKKTVFTGPRGGRFYKTDKGERVYIDEKKSFRGLRKMLMEEKKISLRGYIKREKRSSASL